jgi:MoxR-like ATPase
MKKEDWWIYEGTGDLEAIKDKKPNWRDKSKSYANIDAYQIFSKEVIDAVNTAIYLRRPLLVTGNAGVGKSSLAKSIAKQLTSKDVLRWDITSKSVLKDALYSYDALQRLQDIQMKKLYADQGDMQKSESFNTNIGEYLKLGALGEAFLSKEPRVVLIDEIDKCDIDLPNDLLHIFEEQEFVIDEVKRSREEEITIDGRAIPSSGLVECQEDFPIIVMTSNGEKEFPPAFLRRCISISISLPSSKEEQISKLTNMVVAHFMDGDLEESKKEEQLQELTKNLDSLVEKFVDLKMDENRLLANDQLLNACYLVLNTNMSYEDFKESVLKSLG